MKSNKRFRFLMVNAKLARDQQRCDGAAIKFLQAMLNVPHLQAVNLWFNYQYKQTPRGVTHNSMYRFLVKDQDASRQRVFIEKSTRMAIVFGKPTPIFSY